MGFFFWEPGTGEAGRMCVRASLSFVFLGVFMCGCLSVSKRMFYQVDENGKIVHKSLDRMVWEKTLGADDERRSTGIVSGDFSSSHLVQVRGAESPRIHKFHDVVIFLESGSGIMHLGKESVRAGEGAVFFIEHGTLYRYESTSQTPSVLLFLYSPPYDEKDNMPVEPMRENPK
jgi:mannose-6-phosphate isomerase-like protein (cupin superfamily)